MRRLAFSMIESAANVEAIVSISNTTVAAPTYRTLPPILADAVVGFTRICAVMNVCSGAFSAFCCEASSATVLSSHTPLSR